MKALLKEPLLHFLLLGALIFAAHRSISRTDASQPGAIVVTQGRIEALATAFQRSWQHPPSASELEELIRDYVREEASAREAIVLGLEKDDTIIRRRLRQKLEFVSEDLAAQPEPTDEQLRAWLRSHADAFRIEPKLTFLQVYLKPERDAAALLARLTRAGAGADLAGVGDSFLLEHEFGSVPAGEVAKQFGEPFVAKLRELPIGQWHGPIESGYGRHLVLVRERTNNRLPTLEEVRGAVRRDWANAQRLAANERFYQALLRRYAVTIERPKPAQGAEMQQARR
jgi:hypothetical protein